jgi:hypothetical protein
VWSKRLEHKTTGALNICGTGTATELLGIAAQKWDLGQVEAGETISVLDADIAER